MTRLTITCNGETRFDQDVEAYEMVFYSPSPDGDMPEHSITLSATIKRES